MGILETIREYFESQKTSCNWRSGVRNWNFEGTVRSRNDWDGSSWENEGVPGRETQKERKWGPVELERSQEK